MIVIKSESEIAAMRLACKISAQALKLAGELIKEGVTTRQLDSEVHKFIVSCGAKPSFLGYGGFPNALCISLNDTVIHGIPGDSRIVSGDIVSIDVGAHINGFHGDNAYTFEVGKVDAAAHRLLEVTKRSLELGIAKAVVGGRVGDIGAAVQQHAEAHGYGVVRQFVGHGVGGKLHEDPEVPNYGRAGSGARLYAGMTIAIEPMINEHSGDVKVLKDGWTVKTIDGGLSAHFEHTVLLTPSGPQILTVC